jgi:lipoate-protein ligase A
VHSLYPDAQDYEFTADEAAFIKNLVRKKYSTWEWNFGTSPKYNFSKTIRTSAGTIEFCLQVDNGIIVCARIFGDFFPANDPAILEKELTGLPHKEDNIKSRLDTLDLSRWFNNVSTEELLTGLF